MRAIFILLTVALLTAGCAGMPKNSASLLELNSVDYRSPNCIMDAGSTMKIVELERNANTSKFKLTYGQMGSSVGSSMFILRAFYEVAKARGTEYFTILSEWDDADGGRLYIGGFTNKKDADIHDEFGKQFALTNEYEQARRFLSVSMYNIIFERKGQGIESVDAADKN